MQDLSFLPAARRRGPGRYLPLALLLAAAPFAAQAQTGGVGIGTTAPDVSAALDIVSSSKGALLPRVADATALATPATGLLVFQTGAPAGFYYNVGTPAAPSWQQLATASGAAVTASNGLTRTGQNIALGGTLTQATDVATNGKSFTLSGTGNVGIGTTNAQARFQVVAANGTFEVNGFAPSAGTVLMSQITAVGSNGPQQRFQMAAANGGSYMDIGQSSAGDFVVEGNDAPRLTVQNAGNVGIGTTNPQAKLQVVTGNGTFEVNGFAPDVGTVLMSQLTAVGSNGPQQRFQMAAANGGSYMDIGQNSAGDFVVEGNDLPRLTVQNAGNVGIGTPTPGQKLEVAGQVFSSTGGFRFPDNTVQTTAASGTNFIQNQTTQQASSNFNISGNGLVGGSVGIGASSPLTRLSISPTATEAKLTLFDGGSTTAHYGLGVSASQLNYHVLTTNDRHVFYATGKNGDGTELMRIQGNGNVGIGTAPVANARLQVSGIALVGSSGTLPSATNATGLGWGSLNVGTGESEFYNYRGSGSGGFRFFSVGGTAAPVGSNQIAQISTTGQYSALSDRRVKTNITPLAQGLRTVLALRPVSYDFHTSRRLDANGQVTFLPDDRPVRALGFVAQELLPLVPEAVERPADERRAFYTVSYSTLVPVLTQAIQEQQAQIEALKQEVAAAKAEASSAKAEAARAAADHASLLTLQAQMARLLGEGAQAHK